MLRKTTILTKKERLPWRTLGGEAVIVDLDREKVLCLDGTAGSIWELIDGFATLEAIALKLTREYDVNMVTALEDVAAFAGELLARGLVHEKQP